MGSACHEILLSQTLTILGFRLLFLCSSWAGSAFPFEPKILLLPFFCLHFDFPKLLVGCVVDSVTSSLCWPKSLYELTCALVGQYYALKGAVDVDASFNIILLNTMMI